MISVLTHLCWRHLSWRHGGRRLSALSGILSGRRFGFILRLCLGLVLTGCVSNQNDFSGERFSGNFNPATTAATTTTGEQDTLNSAKPTEKTKQTTITTPAESSETAEGVNNDDNPIDLRRKGRYTIKGKQYEIFASEKNFQEIGMASWYGPGFHGKKTASGEIYNMYDMTAAHKTLPLGTLVEVTDVKRKKKITVRINDRGPFHGGRIIDLSKKAAQELSMLEAGQTKVHIRVID